MQKPKILMVNIAFVPESVGGTEFYTYNLSKSLLQRGYEVIVLTALESLASKRYEVTRTEAEGLEVIRIANSPLYARSFLEHFIDPTIDDLFRDLINEKKPDLIHFQHVAYLSGKFPEIAHQMNVPSIFTLHDYWYMCYRSRLLTPGSEICPGPHEGARCVTCHDASMPHPMAVARSPLLMNLISSPAIRTLMTNSMDRIPQPLLSQARTLLFRDPKQNGQEDSDSASWEAGSRYRHEFFKKQFQYPRFVLSPSHYLKQRYEDEGYREIQVLPLGFHRPEKLEPLPFQGQLNIAFIGNIERHKGVGVLLRELLPLQDSGKVKVNIHGRAKDPIYYSEIEKIARRYPLEMIAFHGGFRSDRDLEAILSKNHIMVFPSIWEENAPLVVREAFLYGVPVIGSDVGGVPEIIDDGVNGFLFDPFVEGDLLKLIERLLMDPDQLKRITQGAQDTQIESMTDHVDKLISLYDRVLKDDQSG